MTCYLCLLQCAALITVTFWVRSKLRKVSNSYSVSDIVPAEVEFSTSYKQLTLPFLFVCFMILAKCFLKEKKKITWNEKMRSKESLLHLKMCLFNCVDFQMPPSRPESTCNPWDPSTPFVEKPTPLAGKGASRCYRHVNCYDHVLCFLGFCLHIPSLWPALPVLLVCLLLLSHWCTSLNPLFIPLCASSQEIAALSDDV